MTSCNPPLPSASDRRYGQRFAVELPLKWRAAGREFVASHTRNMSSSGLAISIGGTAPKVGAKIEVVVDWPVLLNGTIGLQLWLFGKVVRCGVGEFAVNYRRYEIRTKAARGVDQFLAGDRVPIRIDPNDLQV